MDFLDRSWGMVRMVRYAGNQNLLDFGMIKVPANTPYLEKLERL